MSALPSVDAYFKDLVLHSVTLFGYEFILTGWTDTAYVWADGFVNGPSSLRFDAHFGNSATWDQAENDRVSQLLDRWVSDATSLEAFSVLARDGHILTDGTNYIAYPRVPVPLPFEVPA